MTVSRKTGLITFVNQITLLGAIVYLLVMPISKKIWYDESVSILISHGIGHDTPQLLASRPSISSSQLENLNTPANVLHATIVDNGNSILYNILLHYYARAFGSSITEYMWFSKIAGIITLVLFFLLCEQFTGGTIFTSFALLFLLTNGVFWGMSHEIRAYQLGMCFIVGAALFVSRFIFYKARRRYLFAMSLCMVAAVLCHYLSIYAIVVMLLFLFIVNFSVVLKPLNIVAFTLPFALLGIYLYVASTGFVTMGHQNATIAERKSAEPFSIPGVLAKSAKFADLNFNLSFPAFRDLAPITYGCLVLVILIAVLGFLAADTIKSRQKLVFLLAGGFSSVLFLGALSIKAHHYTPLYFRYYSFAIPFSSLSMIYCSMLLWRTGTIFLKGVSVVSLLLFAPSILLHAMVVREKADRVNYSHVELATNLSTHHIHAVNVPKISDVFLIQCNLPAHYTLNYFVDSTRGNNFAWIKDGNIQLYPVIHIDR